MMTLTAIVAVVLGFWFGVLLSNISLHILMTKPEDVKHGRIVFLNVGYWSMVILSFAAVYGCIRTFLW